MENSPDKGSVCKRCKKARNMTNTVGRAKRGDWVEGVIFKPKAAAKKARLMGAGLPMDSGTWLGFEQRRPGAGPYCLLRACLDSVSYPGTKALRPPSLLHVPADLSTLHSTGHHSPPGTRTTALVLACPF